MSKYRDVEPNDGAFPLPDQELGLTKRETFAAMAMQGILAHFNIKDNDSEWHPDAMAGMACECADCLIRELNVEAPHAS